MASAIARARPGSLATKQASTSAISGSWANWLMRGAVLEGSAPVERLTGGASGAIELVATVLALEHGVLPPTINYSVPDPECDLDFVPNEARPCQVDAAVSSSFAFGGLNAVLAVKRA